MQFILSHNANNTCIYVLYINNKPVTGEIYTF